MWRQLSVSFRLLLVLTVVTGLIYPGFVAGLARLFFRQNADGSLIVRDGRVVGSVLIGQKFQRPEYFQPRPSAAGASGYDASLSGGSNLGPTNRMLAVRVGTAVRKFRRRTPSTRGPSPRTCSPHRQADSILTRVRRQLLPRLRVWPVCALFPSGKIESLVDRYIEGRDLGFIGEPRVNVLLLNMSVDRDFPAEGHGGEL